MSCFKNANCAYVHSTSIDRYVLCVNILMFALYLTREICPVQAAEPFAKAFCLMRMCSDVFGRVRTCSDEFECAQMCSDLGRVSDCKKSHVQGLNFLSYDLLIIVLARSVQTAFRSEHWSERLNAEHLFSER